MQIESTFSALLIFLKLIDPSVVTGSAYAFGSENIVSAYEPLLRPVAEIAPFVAAAATCLWFWRAQKGNASEFDRLILLGKGVCAIIVAFAALGKVFSPQYLIWLTPVAAVVSLRSSRAAKKLLFAGLVLSQLEYPYCYVFLTDGLPPVFGLLVLLRNGALIAWAALLLTGSGETEAVREAPPALAVRTAE